ncbi:splicing factor, Prp19-binding domain-containing protein [Delphinella strobiligena]|nr:splicing factor, Prp19-binding domain-containing protein [Delphinella strobiligena]
MPLKKMTANPLAPLRYRPGKPVGAEEPSSSSEEDSGSDSEAESQTAKALAPKATSFPKINAGLSKEELEKRRQEAIAARAREAEQAQKAEDGFVTASESEEEGSEEEESEEEESSEDEARQRKFIAPTFVKKNQRKQSATAEKTAEQIAAEEERRRQEKADEMLQAQIEKDAAERAAGHRAWDDDDDAVADDVDDTDGLDPEAERAAWKLRELKRVKRERAAIEEAEKEREEVERRRNLSAAEREAEDKEFIEAQKAEREGKGQMGFMQKYFHKGAFFQGEGGEAEEAAKRRDIMGARYVDDAINRELLPQYMQIRDMTKLGKKGRTKYRDMKSEDTGRWGENFADMSRPGGGMDRFKNDQEGPSGANASAVGERRRRDDDRQGGRDEKRPRHDR